MDPSIGNNCDTQQFWTGIKVLINNFHVVSKKVFATKIVGIQKLVHQNGIDQIKNWVSQEELLKLPNLKLSISNKLVLMEALTNVDSNSNNSQNCIGFIIHFEFLSKRQNEISISAMGVVNFISTSYRCFFHKSNWDDFDVVFCNQKIHFNVLTERSPITSQNWREKVLQPKVLKWCHPIPSVLNKNGQSASLELIDVERYNELYKNLKQKYLRPTTELWKQAKESTNPSKYISEDLAIAAYLICLWEKHTSGNIPVVFCDLGCGNGLLVYILRSEGYKGYGYDLRARRLWTLYPLANLNLIEQPINPQSFSLPIKVNWVIGNHSDELSPWIPVLAAKNDPKINFFLLPCCAFEFSGSKFQRRNTNVSVYQDFLNYAINFSEICGYRVLRDRLKIPSTKRIAIVGFVDPKQNVSFDTIWLLVNYEIQKYANNSENSVKLREKKELVRNCTQIDKGVLDGLVLKIFNLLLLTDTNNGNSVPWRRGGHLTMSEIAKQLSSDDLKQIKSEYGGLKTLLRNKHEIFEFCEKMSIGIRMPAIKEANGEPQTVKKRRCFFDENHPDGCPLTDEQCTFIHKPKSSR